MQCLAGTPDCYGDDVWFDRSVCPEPCDRMHNCCDKCGAAMEYCPFEKEDEMDRHSIMWSEVAYWLRKNDPDGEVRDIITETYQQAANEFREMSEDLEGCYKADGCRAKAVVYQYLADVIEKDLAR